MKPKRRPRDTTRLMETKPLVLANLLLTLFSMALISFFPTTPNANHPSHHHHYQITNKKKKKKSAPPPPPTKLSIPSSWEQFKNLLSCKSTTPSLIHDPSSSSSSSSKTTTTKYTKLSSCGSSICALRDVVHGNTRVIDHSLSSEGSGSHSNPIPTPPSKGGMQLRRFSGCYECHAVDAEPALRRCPRPRTLCPCTECGEVFTKSESLEHHQALRHAVSELGPDDSGRNIVEIIFKSSWQKKENPICKIERILKVHNTQRTITRFEDYRDSVKSRALLHLLPPRKNPRCAADGNELLRFHCTSLSCSLGADSSTSLCLSSSNSVTSSLPCGVCTIIRHGFSRAQHQLQGVRTTASSGRAHDCGPQSHSGGQRAMLVCRVIAGRVKRGGDEQSVEEGSGASLYDSVAGEGVVGSCADLEELFVANPRAILPCFVVIYRAMDN